MTTRIACPRCGRRMSMYSKRCAVCRAADGRKPTLINGYIFLYRPGHPFAQASGYVAEHRWLLHEMAIPVPPRHHVHHRDGCKTNNVWSNLEVLPEGDHHRLHLSPGTMVKNQYGEFTVAADDAERRRRNVEKTLRSRAKHGRKS